MSHESSPLPKDSVNYFGLWLKGAFISNIAGLACLGVLTFVVSDYNIGRLGDLGQLTSTILVASTFLALPFAMGFGAAFFWMPAKLSGNGRFGWTFCNLLVSLGGSVLILREGTICLIMASLLLLILMWVGCEVGTQFWERSPYLGATIIPLLLLVAWYDASQPHFYANKVQTTRHSNLPPSQLWPYVASYPRNEAPPEWWLWKVGLPYPLEVKGEPRVGGRRDCVFSGGVMVGEKVVAVEEGRMIEFAIDKQPNHPEAMNHFKVVRARLELLPDGRGGTIMRGTGWYELQVYPTWYFGPWSDAVLHHVHERVFAHMERLARLDQKRTRLALHSSDMAVF